MAEYIDKELVIDTIDELKSKALPKALLFDHLKKVIEVFPTKDFAPVVHAHWIKTGGYVCGDHEYICSRCNETYWEGDNYAERAQWCLSCGAKMDEKEI